MLSFRKKQQTNLYSQIRTENDFPRDVKHNKNLDRGLLWNGTIRTVLHRSCTRATIILSVSLQF